MKPRPELLDAALLCGAKMTGKPDGSEAITIVFTIDAWRKFDAALVAPEPPRHEFNSGDLMAAMMRDGAGS